MDVAAGGEGALSCSSEDDGADGVVGLGGIEERKQAINQRIVQGVELFRPIKCEDGDPVAGLGEHKLGHVFSFPVFVDGEDQAFGCMYIH